MRSTNYFLIPYLISFAIACKSPLTKNEHDNVVHKGALKNFMMDGDISAKADLQDLKNIDHLYALGALENLEGEIQIFESDPSISSVLNNQLIIKDSFTDKASLLIYTSVEKWRNISIPSEVLTYEHLEVFIEKTAEENDIDTEKPFPFLIEGIIESLDWHVINWKKGDTIHTHEKHRTSGLYGALKNKNVEILGFYSNKHHSIFTHHTTNMHLHFKTAANDIAGHIDGLTMGANMILKLPEK